MDEKSAGTDHVEGIIGSAQAGDPDTLGSGIHLKEALHDGADLDDAVVKKLLHKVDWRLIPALSFLYALALIDRGNLPAVSILHLSCGLILTWSRHDSQAWTKS